MRFAVVVKDTVLQCEQAKQRHVLRKYIINADSFLLLTSKEHFHDRTSISS